MISAPKYAHNFELFREVLHEVTIPRAIKILDVTERTIRRWMAQEHAPKAAMLALFWESRYGRSIIDADHHTELQIVYSHIRVLEGQVLKAKDIITGLRAAKTGSANEPLFDDLTDFVAVPFPHHAVEQPARTAAARR